MLTQLKVGVSNIASSSQQYEAVEEDVGTTLRLGDVLQDVLFRYKQVSNLRPHQGVRIGSMAPSVCVWAE
jgi:hypothetical protein